MDKVTVIGATSWGLTIGLVMSQVKGHSVTVLTRTSEEARELEQTRANERLLPGIKFPEQLRFSCLEADCLGDADIVFEAVPFGSLRSSLRKLSSYLKGGTVFICASKGIESDTGYTASQIATEELKSLKADNIGVLSGPNLAREIAAGHTACATLAFPKLETAAKIQPLLSHSDFRVYISDDPIGVGIGGAYKNMLAMVAGYMDEMEAGNNAKAALLTRGLYEMANFGTNLGASMETFFGLSGLGDMMATCYSKLSRNYRMGLKIAQGKSVEEAKREINQTVEGLETTRSIARIAEERKIKAPIARIVNQVICGQPPTNAGTELLDSYPSVEMPKLYEARRKRDS